MSTALTKYSTLFLDNFINAPADNKIDFFLWNPEVHYCVHNSPLLESILLSQLNPILQLNVMVKISCHIWEVTASNPGPETGYPDRCYSWLFSVLQGKCWDSTLN
jgi:hypothetical protein